jgi:hypothetical protein
MTNPRRFLHFCAFVSLYLITSSYFNFKLFGNIAHEKGPNHNLLSSDVKGEELLVEERQRQYFRKGCSISNVMQSTTTSSSSSQIISSSSFHFPNPQERIRYYMGSWYNRSTSDNDDHPTNNNNATAAMSPSFCKGLQIGTLTSIPSDESTLYSFRTLLDRHKMKENWLSSYLKDAANVLTHIESTVDQGKEEDIFVILHIGDSSSNNPHIPSVSKARKIAKQDDEYSSIVWPLRLGHHFKNQFEKLFAAQDTPWEQKKNAIVWRGACTGTGSKNRGASQTGSRLTFVQKFALRNDESDSKINIGMIGSCSPFGIRLENKYFKKEMNVEEMLSYKYLLSLEGNDVATGLKWKLASSSVVFMPDPTAESFAMEGLLQPFVHYIPVQRDGSDLEKMIQWAEENDSKAKWISDQATEFMNNLWFSEKARMDNMLIKNELANLYHRQFRKSLQVCYSYNSKNAKAA